MASVLLTIGVSAKCDILLIGCIAGVGSLFVANPDLMTVARYGGRPSSSGTARALLSALRGRAGAGSRRAQAHVAQAGAARGCRVQPAQPARLPRQPWSSSVPSSQQAWTCARSSRPARSARRSWFLLLGYGARLLAPLFAKPVAWRAGRVGGADAVLAIAASLLLAWGRATEDATPVWGKGGVYARSRASFRAPAGAPTRAAGLPLPCERRQARNGARSAASRSCGVAPGWDVHVAERVNQAAIIAPLLRTSCARIRSPPCPNACRRPPVRPAQAPPDPVCRKVAGLEGGKGDDRGDPLVRGATAEYRWRRRRTPIRRATRASTSLLPRRCVTGARPIADRTSSARSTVRQPVRADRVRPRSSRPKGHFYSTTALVGGDRALAARFESGDFATPSICRRATTTASHAPAPQTTQMITCPGSCSR